MNPTPKKSGGIKMISERTLLPAWAKTAATVLSDAQIGALDAERPSETVARTVSRKEKPCPPHRCPRYHKQLIKNRNPNWGFICESKCGWIPMKGCEPDYIRVGSEQFGRSYALHFPHRCKRCKSRMQRWTCAARNYDRLELLRLNDEIPNLKMTTFTHKEWELSIAAGGENFSAWCSADKIKKSASRKHRNWRNRNDYWKSLDAKGQAYHECTMYPVWKGWGFDEIKLHFHIHMVLCSKYIENSDIQTCHGRACCEDENCVKPIPMSTTIQREWGGIVDVRKCKTWKHNDGEVKTSRRSVMSYLVDYMNKQAHWQSSKIGRW